MPHNKYKWKISECDPEWLTKQNLPATCRCGRKGIWVVGINSVGWSSGSHAGDTKVVGPYCNNCVVREYMSS